MSELLTRLLIACLCLWLVDKILSVFGVSEPANKIVQIVAIIVALIFIFAGWMLGVR